MSRKRASARLRAQTAVLDPSVPNPVAGSEQYAYQYYRPGCYCTPQVLRQQTPYTCGTCFYGFPIPCGSDSEATYVVDSCGMVYYLSDFEHLLQLPGSLAIQTETEITYHYQYADDEREEMAEEEAAVSPRKRERLETEGDGDIDGDGPPPDYDISDSNESESSVKAVEKKKPQETGNVYRSEEGYLVEEPYEEPDVSTPK